MFQSSVQSWPGSLDMVQYSFSALDQICYFINIIDIVVKPHIRGTVLILSILTYKLVIFETWSNVKLAIWDRAMFFDLKRFKLKLRIAVCFVDLLWLNNIATITLNDKISDPTPLRSSRLSAANLGYSFWIHFELNNMKLFNPESLQGQICILWNH